MKKVIKFLHFIGVLQMDKQLHFLYGLMIYSWAKPFFGWKVALILALVIGIAKELIWDKYLRRGTPEVLDIVYTFLGALYFHFYLTYLC